MQTKILGLATELRSLLACLRGLYELVAHHFLILVSYFSELSKTRSPSLKTIRLLPGDNIQHVLHAQWNQDKEERFIIQLPFRKIHVLPSCYLNDYGWKNDDEISSNIDLRERILGYWTLLGSKTPMEPGDRTHSAVTFIKDSMTANMTAYTEAVHDAINAAIETHIGSSHTWSGQSAYQLGVDLNLRIFERVFVGLNLCNNDDWNSACRNYSTSAISTAATLMGYTWWQRPFIAPFVTEYRNLKKHINNLQAHLDPVLKTRLAQAMEQYAPSEPKDFISWWVSKAPAHKRSDSYALTLALIQLNIAGIQSTGMVLMRALIDLSGRPEHTSPLLSEMSQVIEAESEHGDGATLPPRAIAKLLKLDSFLKESQRHVAQNLLSIYRKVLSPLRLHDGSVLPAGSYVAVQSVDPDARPGSITRDFDAFRWARLRAEPGNARRFTTVVSALDSLEFGYGVHACPGRFFAMNVVKATLVAILRRYELRLPPGEGIPPNRYNPLLVLVPPKEQKVEFREREQFVC